MRINELLVESQQLDEGPFTQAVGKVGGKIAKGVANIGKDLKTGFKAGYSGEQPPADAAAPTQATPVKKAAPAAAATTQAAPVQKAAGGGIIDKIKQGFAQGQAAPVAGAAPAADPAAEKQSKIGVGQINKIIPTLRTRDLMSLKKNLDTVIAKKSAEKPAAKPAAAAPAAGTTTAAPDADATPTSAEQDAADARVAAAGGSPEEVAKQRAAREKTVAARKPRAKKPAAPSQSEIDADREARMGNFTDAIERHKQRMVAEGLANGSISIFKK